MENDPLTLNQDNRRTRRVYFTDIVGSWLRRKELPTNHLDILNHLFGPETYNRLPNFRLGLVSLYGNTIMDAENSLDPDLVHLPFRYSYAYGKKTTFDGMTAFHMFYNPEGQGLVPHRFWNRYKTRSNITFEKVTLADVHSICPEGTDLEQNPDLLFEGERFGGSFRVMIRNTDRHNAAKHSFCEYYLTGIIRQDSLMPTGTLFVIKPPDQGGGRREQNGSTSFGWGDLPGTVPHAV